MDVTENCSNCIHWRPHDEKQTGECRRFPPKMIPIPTSKIAMPADNGVTGFTVTILPRITPAEYDCGEWEHVGADPESPGMTE